LIGKEIAFIKLTLKHKTSNIQTLLQQKGNSMTFEQWAEEMKKGLSLRSDGNPKGPSRYNSTPSWNYNRFEGEIEEEEPTYNPSQNS